MAAPYSNTQLRVPPGFQNVLEGLSREVLRHQPENIYEFATKYFADLLQRRQETGEDDIALLGAKLEDRYYNNKAFGQGDINERDPLQQDAAVKIQSEYRRHAAQKEMQTRKEEEAVTTIQASFRGYQDRVRVAEMKKEMDSARELEEADKEEEEEVKNEAELEGENEEQRTAELDEAATKIQAAFKGYMTRKGQTQSQSKTSQREESQDALAPQELVSHEPSVQHEEVNETVEEDKNDSEEVLERVSIDDNQQVNKEIEDIEPVEDHLEEVQHSVQDVDNGDEMDLFGEDVQQEEAPESHQEQVPDQVSHRSSSAGAVRNLEDNEAVMEGEEQELFAEGEMEEAPSTEGDENEETEGLEEEY